MHLKKIQFIIIDMNLILLGKIIIKVLSLQTIELNYLYKIICFLKKHFSYLN